MNDKEKAKSLARIGMLMLPPELKGSHSEFGLKAIIEGEDPISIGQAIAMDGYHRNVKAFEVGGRFHPDTISPCCGRPNRECGAYGSIMTKMQMLAETMDLVEKQNKSKARRDPSIDDSAVNGIDIERIAGAENENPAEFFRRLGVDFESLPKQ